MRKLAALVILTTLGLTSPAWARATPGADETLVMNSFLVCLSAAEGAPWQVAAMELGYTDIGNGVFSAKVNGREVRMHAMPTPDSPSICSVSIRAPLADTAGVERSLDAWGKANGYERAPADELPDAMILALEKPGADRQVILTGPLPDRIPSTNISVFYIPKARP